MDEGKLKAELAKLREGWIVVVKTEPEDALKATIETIKSLSEKGYKGVILLTNRTYLSMRDLCRDQGIDDHRLRFIDSISMTKTVDVLKEENVRYIREVGNVTDISLAVHGAMHVAGEKSFFLIDSIDNFLNFLKPTVLYKFIHSLIIKMQIEKRNGVLIYSESDRSKDLWAQIVPMCDKVVKV